MREGKKLPSYWEKFKRGKRERKKNRGKIKTERFKLDYLYITLFYILQLLFFIFLFWLHFGFYPSNFDDRTEQSGKSLSYFKVYGVQ